MTDNDAMTSSDDQGSSTVTESNTQQQVQEDRGSFVPLIFGGAFACALGFFAAQIDGIERALGLNDPSVELAQEISDQNDKISNLAGQIADIPKAAPVDLSGITSRLADLSDKTDAVAAQVSAQDAALAGFDDRLTALEKRPMSEGLSPEAIAAYEAELERLQAGVDSSRSEIEGLVTAAKDSETEAQRQANLALSRASMSRIVAAVESGAPFADAIADLQETAATEVPAALTNQADNGVPTLAVLQDEFPDLSRAALAAAREEAAADGDGGVLSFVQRRLGARSVVPQEGDSADAVLSRTEAALRSGNLGEALAETEALPDVSKAVLADWIAKATARNDALRAADDLMSSLSTN